MVSMVDPMSEAMMEASVEGDEAMRKAYEIDSTTSSLQGTSMLNLEILVAYLC